MRTHVDTAAAVRLRDTDQFARVTVAAMGLPMIEWGPMSPETSFFEEDDGTVLPRVLEHPHTERVRVSRVIDIVS